jgi:hypothetical protein
MLAYAQSLGQLGIAPNHSTTRAQIMIIGGAAPGTGGCLSIPLFPREIPRGAASVWYLAVYATLCYDLERRPAGPGSARRPACCSRFRGLAMFILASARSGSNAMPNVQNVRLHRIQTHIIDALMSQCHTHHASFVGRFPNAHAPAPWRHCIGEIVDI